jgi:hypothetical protein
MKTYGSNTTAYRSAGKAHHQVNLVSFKVKGIDSPYAEVWYHFTSEEDDRTVTLTDPDTGGSASRTFKGGGHLLGIDALVRSEGAVIRNHALVLSGASSDVLAMVYGYNCREAPFQWFVGELDQDTGLLVDMPSCEFVGSIETIDQNDGALELGSAEAASTDITVSVVSISADLRRNFDMRSVEVSQRRSGDTFLQHGDSAHHWVQFWGKESKSEKDRKGGGAGKNGDGGTGIGRGINGR